MSVCFLCSPANVQTSVFGKACQCDYLQTRGSLLGIYLYVSDGINHMLVAVVLCDTRLYLSLRGLTWIMYHGSQYENSMEDTHMLTSKHMSFLNGLIWQRQSQLVAHSTQGAQKADTEVRESVCVYVCARARLLISQQTKEIQTTDCVKKNLNPQENRFYLIFEPSLAAEGATHWQSQLREI